MGSRKITIAALFVITVFNYMDRSLIAVLLEDIKNDFALGDIQIGVLSGLPFALLYALVGIPFARVADIGNRRYLVAAAVAMWSLATVGCAFAVGFLSLFMWRVFVGIGEGAGTPATHSIMADAYDPTRRSAGAALLTLAAAAGGFLGFGAGGLIASELGWRAAFVIIGAPGLLVAFFALRALPEPRSKPRLPSMSETFGGEALGIFRVLLGRRAFLLLLIAFSIEYFVQMGVLQWLAVYLIRTYDTTTGEAGLIVGTFSSLSLAVGGLAGGFIGNWLAPRNLAWLLRISSLCCLLSLPCYVGLLVSPHLALTIGLIVASSTITGILFAPTFAAIYGLSGGQARATAVALVALFTNIVGMGLGPFAVGILSESFRAPAGEDALQWALLVVSSLMLPAAIMFYLASRRIAHDWQGEPSSPVLAH